MADINIQLKNQSGDNLFPKTKVVYSTTEYDTGKTWIDGKKIYGKVITGTSGATTSNIIATISNMDLLIDYKGYFYISEMQFFVGKGIYPLSVGETTTRLIVTNTKKIQLDIGSGYYSIPYVFILEYTKN